MPDKIKKAYVRNIGKCVDIINHKWFKGGKIVGVRGDTAY